MFIAITKNMQTDENRVRGKITHTHRLPQGYYLLCPCAIGIS